MAKTRIRVLDGDVMEFYSTNNSKQYRLGTTHDTRLKLTSNGAALLLTIFASSAGKQCGIFLEDTDGANTCIITKETNNDFLIGGASNNFIRIVNSSNDLILQEDAAGNVGIAVTPLEVLHVKGADLDGIRIESSVNSSVLDFYQTGLNNASARNWRIDINDSAWGSLEFKVSSANNTAPSASKLLIDLNGNIGIGVTPSSGILHIKAGTTTLAPLRLTSSSAAILTSVTADCIEYDGEGIFYTLEKTLRHALGGTIYLTDTEAGTTANSGSEASVLASSGNPIDWETLTVPADYMVNGKTLRFKAWGYLTSNAASTTYTVRFKFGSTYKATATFTITGAITRKYWECELLLTCRNSGASAYFQPDSSNAYDIGILRYDSSGAGVMLDALFNVASSTTNTFDTTASNVIDLTCAMSGTYTTAVFKCATAVIEMIGA